MRFATRIKPTSHLIDMTPVVNIVFLLLIFFIITSDTLPLKSLPVQTPKLAVSGKSLTAQLMVVVDAHEVIYVGSKKIIVELSMLTEELKKQIARYKNLHEGTTPTIVLQLDRSVKYDTFLQTFYAAQQAGSQLRLAYTAEDEDMDAASFR